MRYSFVTAAVLLSSALAVPHNKGHHDQGHHCRRHDKNCHPSFAGTALPITTGPAATGTASFDASALPTGLYPIVSQPNDDHGSAASPAETSPEMPPPIADKHAVKGDSDKCDGSTVTVTSQTTHTVTLSPDTAPSSSAPPTSPVVPDVEEPQVEAKAADDAPTPSKSSSPPVDDDTPPPSTEPSPSPSPKAAAAEAKPADDTPTPDTPSTNAPAPQSGLPFKTKRGIIASGGSMNALAGAMGVGKVSWLGNWYSAPPHTIAPSLTFVPQNYGKQSDVTGEWTRNAKQAVAKGAKYMLSFGEPGTPNDKLHLEPGDGVKLWMDKMEPFAKQGVSIGAPGTLQNTQDFTWLKAFLEQCTGCTIGFIAMHWFDKAGAKQVPGFKETLQKAKVIADQYNIPVWLDNFSAQGDAAAQREFLGEVVPWLDSQEWIKAYAYVPPEVGKAGSGANMVDGDSLNELGQYYANL